MEYEFAVIGHVGLDLMHGRWVSGGPAYYSSLTAAHLGRRVALLTRGAPKESQQSLGSLAKVVNLPSSTTTKFQTHYINGIRTQHVRSVGAPIQAHHLPTGWSDSPIVLLAPFAGEIDPDLAFRFPGSLLGISPQGWMRHWDASGLVTPTSWARSNVLKRARVTFLSEVDIPTKCHPLTDIADEGILIITLGFRGAVLRWKGQWYRVPAYPAQEMDSTGAGDVFAAAYLIRYSETKDPLASSLYASCAASIKVEAHGLEGIPTIDQINDRASRHPQLNVIPCIYPF